MWQQIHDCGKQLNINYRIRQFIQDEDLYITEYKIAEIDIDEYQLHIISKLKNGVEVPIDPVEVVVLTCEKIIDYQFEVWTENNNL